MCQSSDISKTSDQLPSFVNGISKALRILKKIDGDSVRKTILYIHIVTYPITTIVLMLGRDAENLYKIGFQSLQSDLVSFGLSMSILLSLGISTSVAFYLITTSYKKFCFWKLQIYTVIYFTSIILNNLMYSFKNERDGKINQRGVFFSTLNLFHMWQFILDGTTLMITIEQFKFEHGFLRRRSFFGIPLVKFVYAELALVWVACLVLELVICYIFVHFEGHQNAVAVRELVGPFIGFNVPLILWGLAGILLWIGISKKSPKLLRVYLAIKIILFIPLAISWNIVNYRMALRVTKKPADPFSKMLPMFAALLYIIGLFVNDCFIRSFSEYLNGMDKIKTYSASRLTNLSHYKKEFLSKETKHNHMEKLTNEFLKFEHISRIVVRINDAECNEIGSGQSSKVYKGTLSNKLTYLEAGATVAIKMLRESDEKFEFNLNMTESYVLAVFSEIKFLNTCSKGHENLVKFYGVTRHAGDLGIVMEYCSGGSLKAYLRAKRKAHDFSAAIDKQEVSKLHKWAAQVASAFQFLSSKQIVHGDLAARNILLDKHGTAKVTDFGSSIHLYNYQSSSAKSQQSVFPWRWMAPESLSDLKFSIASDIWSYGVLLWELYSFGKIPWQGLEWTLDFVLGLKAGIILEKPQFASLAIYEKVMCKCLRVLESDRMSFADISTFYLTMKSTRNRRQNEYISRVAKQ